MAVRRRWTQTKTNVLALAVVGFACVPARHHAHSGAHAETLETPVVVADAALRERIQAHLAREMGGAAGAVRVQVVDGVASLTGSVPTRLEQRRVASVARAVRGVRSVVDRVEVDAPKVPDVVLRETVAAALDDAGLGARLKVGAVGGIVTMRGEVLSSGERERAQRVAENVVGVRGVVLILEVGSGVRSDPSIAREIEDALAWSPLVDHHKVVAQVSAGRVQLRGEVPGAIEANAAERLAYVRGVEDVDASALRVRPEPSELWDEASLRIPDRWIEDAIEAATTLDPRVPVASVRSESVGGVVTLQGAVPSVRARDAVVQNARNTPGVERVVSTLQVKREGVAHDEILEVRVTDALRREDAVRARAIEVDVADGVATLTGTMPCLEDPQWAVGVTGRVAGVRDVKSELGVVYREVRRPPSHVHWAQAFVPYAGPSRAPVEVAVVPRRDADLERSIQRQLYWSPFVDAAGVGVHAREGRVVLTGTVEDDAEHAAAIENAYDGGARVVVDRLRVTGAAVAW